MRRLILIFILTCCIGIGANAASAWERTGGKINTERIDGEYPELETLRLETENVLNNAYLDTME